jgi:hypothetical protein
MTSDEVQKFFSAVAGKNLPKKRRETPASRRKEVAQAQVDALERVEKAIRARARETPTWAAAYNSAATAVELEIAFIRKDAKL